MRIFQSFEAKLIWLSASKLPFRRDNDKTFGDVIEVDFKLHKLQEEVQISI